MNNNNANLFARAFFGKYDRFHKAIHEGDIVLVKYADGSTSTGVIRYSDSNAAFVVAHINPKLNEGWKSWWGQEGDDSLEVLGSIYDKEAEAV